MNAQPANASMSTPPGHGVRLAALLFGTLSLLASVTSVSAVSAGTTAAAQASATGPHAVEGWNWA